MKKASLLIILVAALLTTFARGSAAGAQAGGDIRRRTIAITYYKDPVTVQFAGTTLRPNAKGEAAVERWRKRNESEIDLTIENMIPAFNFGGDYTTYVLWAITPAGQVDNLGEFRLSGGSARLKAATPHQTFAMIITAEPHYLVKLPSRMVVLENLAPTSKNVSVQASEVYFTGDSGAFYKDVTVPTLAERDYNKTPMELLQARRAVQIARLADAERHDPNDYNQAVNLLSQAEEAHRRGANVHEIGRMSRDSISIAERAREISEERAVASERRAEIARRDAEVRRVTENASDLTERLSDTEARLKAAEIARTSMTDQLDRAMREGADARAENRSLRNDNERLRSEVDRLSHDLGQARATIQDLQTQYSSTTAKLSETASRVETMEKMEREKQQAETRRREFSALQSTLASIVTVKSNGNGFVAILPDVFFVPNQPTLALRAKSKIDALAQTLAAHPEAVFAIEGHSDARPAADSFALGRAQAVADYIAALGVSPRNFKVESRAATVPLSTRKTIAARTMNRRVELTFTAPR
jgi:outer membrane protein OmpA-like peptidoglycan-associated protein